MKSRFFVHVFTLLVHKNVTCFPFSLNVNKCKVGAYQDIHPRQFIAHSHRYPSNTGMSDGEISWSKEYSLLYQLYLRRVQANYNTVALLCVAITFKSIRIQASFICTYTLNLYGIEFADFLLI